MSKTRAYYSIAMIPNQAKSFQIVLAPLLTLTALVSLHFLKGPFWLGTNFDPAYAYLLDGLNIRLGETVGNATHPGTPLQTLYALWIFLFERGSSPEAIRLGVLSNAEFYLNSVNLALMVGTSFLLLLIGMECRKQKRNWTFTLINQLPLFLVPSLVPTFLRADPAAMNSLWILGCVFLMIKSQGERPPGPKQWGCVIALGIATKMNFIPLAVLPLFVLRRKQYGTYLWTTAAGLAILLIPIYSRMWDLIQWTYKIAFYDGYYGSGQLGLPTQKAIETLGQLATQCPVYLFTLATAAYAYFQTEQRPGNRKLILAVGMTLLIQVLVVSLHPKVRYFFPSLMLGALCLSLSIEQLQWKFPSAAVVLFLLIRPIGVVTGYVQEQKEIHRDAQIINSLTSQKGCSVLTYFRSSDRFHALHFSDEPTGRKNQAILDRLKPNRATYTFWTGQLYSARYPGDNDLDTFLSRQSCNLLRGITFFDETAELIFPGKKLAVVYRGKLESLYRLQN